MDARQRSLRSRLGAYAALARNDPREINAEARLTYRDSFRNGHSCRLCPVFATPLGLPESEITRRAEMLRRAHNTRLSLASSRTRSKRRADPDRDSGSAQREGTSDAHAAA
jgi:hypothetical protein